MKLFNNKKSIITINIILTILIFVGNYFYNVTDSLLVKTLTSAGFVLIGLINILYLYYNKLDNSAFVIFMLLGLFFAMLGDVVLELHFILGAALFAIGHIFYLIAYCTLSKINKLDIIISVSIAVLAALFIVLCPLLEFEPAVMMWVCLIYAIIISFMLGKAISNFIRNRSILNTILFIGSLLFFVSDLMLLLDLFMSVGKWAGALCLATYYPAECFLACSILISSIFNHNSINS